jgi:MFS family permease
MSYLLVYYQHSGISIPQIGVLATLPTIFALFGNPLWSALADALHLHRWLLPASIFLTIPCFWLVSQTRSFWLLALFISMYSFCNSPTISLADYATLNLLGE